MEKIPTTQPQQPPTNAHIIPNDNDAIYQQPPGLLPNATIMEDEVDKYQPIHHNYPTRTCRQIANSIVNDTKGEVIPTAFIYPYHQSQTHSKYTLTASVLLHHQLEGKQHFHLPEYHTTMHYSNAVIDKETGKALKYHDLIKHPKYKAIWTKSAANEIRNLAKGVRGQYKGTNTIQFVPKSAIPKGKKITYARIVCEIRPQKPNPYRTCITIGGDRLDYPRETATPTTDLTTSKVLFNSIVSTKNAKFLTMDINKFYLNTPLDIFEYLQMHISQIPDEIIEEYSLKTLVNDKGYVYIQAEKGMYGLAQARILANTLLEKRLSEHGYYQSS